MATTDPAEWRIYSTDYTTQLGVLPFTSSHIYTELNGVGSGEVTIPLDAPIASSVAMSKFCALFYRGSFRVGFIIDSLKYTDADSNEGAGRRLSMLGDGALTVLKQSIVQTTDVSATTRDFTDATKASILITLIDEAQARGELAFLAYDFTATDDSNSVAWTDSENYSLPVGTTLLDVAKQFAGTGGFEFTLDFSAGIFTLGAYSQGRGSDKSATIGFRVGEQVQEVGRDERGEEVFNVYYVKWKNGYITVEDSTSIAAYGRRVKFLSLEQAQSSDSATTYAAAKLALTKDPRTNKTVKVYDGILPRLFEDYDLGDTVSLDRFGTVTDDKILGIQADFDGAEFANVVIDFNAIMYDNEMEMSAQLDWLTDQWSTAHDAGLLEVSKGMSIGFPNGQVNVIHRYGDYIYVGGGFLLIANISASYIAQYHIPTGTWSAMSGISSIVRDICDVNGTIYCAHGQYVKHWNGSAWITDGTFLVGGSGGIAASVYTIAFDGTDSLFAGGTFDYVTEGGINLLKHIGRLGVLGGGVWGTGWWTVGSSSAQAQCNDIVCDGDVYTGFVYFALDYINASFKERSLMDFQYGTGSSFPLSSTYVSSDVNAMDLVAGDLVYLQSDGILRRWNLSGITAETLGTADGFVDLGPLSKITSYLADIIVGGEFTGFDGVAAANIARYSGGAWYPYGSGITGAFAGTGPEVYALCVVDSDVYIGGAFTTFNGESFQNLVAYVTDFESLIDHLINDIGNNFDMGAAIHEATAATLADTDEFGFWSDAVDALRKITWVNIKATIITAFGGLVSNLSAKTTLVDGDDFVISDSAASNATKQISWLSIKTNVINAFGPSIVSVTNKATPVDNDDFALADSAASDATKSITWANIKTALNLLYAPKAPFILSADITPATFSATQNDYNPTGLSTADVLRLECTGANRSITGLAGGADGRIIIIYNIGATYSITLLDGDTGSAAANRFETGGYGVNLVPGASVILQYDSTLSLWRVLDTSASALQGAAITTTIQSALKDGDGLVWDAGSSFFDRRALTGSNGWTPVSDTWTYASASTITIPTDGTLIYQKGMKIRLKQGGGYKYYIVASLTATVITVFVNTDYTVANAAITDIAFSFVENPYAFPASFTYVPAFTALTINNGTLYGKYEVHGTRIVQKAGFIFGSTPSVITGTINLAALATPIALGTTQEYFGATTIRDTGTALFEGTVYLIGGALYPQVSATGGAYAAPSNVTSTVPMTWVSTDELSMICEYSF